jgi:23S rRNA-/tRNA-specific pseudouridylate synthase
MRSMAFIILQNSEQNFQQSEVNKKYYIIGNGVPISSKFEASYLAS